MTETIDTANLRALAEAAPAGPWNPPQELAHRGTVYDRDLGALLTYKSISTERDQCVRYVAAANPAVMLALLDRLAAAEARNATLTDDASNCSEWRRLALQFDNHRMTALWHLKGLLQDPKGHQPAARQFLAGPPLSGEVVLAERLAALARAAASISTKGDGHA